MKSSKISIDFCSKTFGVFRMVVQPNHKCKKMMEKYCELNDIPRDKFKFFYNGKELPEYGTANSIGLKDQSKIIVLMSKYEEDECPIEFVQIENQLKLRQINGFAKQMIEQRKTDQLAPDMPTNSSERSNRKRKRDKFDVPEQPAKFKRPNTPIKNKLDKREANLAAIAKYENVNWAKFFENILSKAMK